ncbi:uncharacterized protein LOC104911235 isoform X2 [Meleagris gallopavo]|uniref:uncharacterized protein LOC104911235 isoform X2 n=1 Tax=Meleagris gallopavo TaxID=9103 RepID=UPI000549A3D6|nr:uncharacterized protein LOC104911235 isoform X2 [Meleagris gallopavo]
MAAKGCSVLLRCLILTSNCPTPASVHTGTAARHQPDRALLPTCLSLKLLTKCPSQGRDPAISRTTPPSMLRAPGGAGRARGIIQWERAILGCERRGGRAAGEPRAVREFRTAREERRLGPEEATRSAAPFRFAFGLAFRPPPLWQAAAGLSRSFSGEFAQCRHSAVPPGGACPGRQGEECLHILWMLPIESDQCLAPLAY